MTLRDALRTLLNGCRLAPWERMVVQAILSGAPLDSVIRTPSIVSAAEAASAGAKVETGNPPSPATESTPAGVASAAAAHPWRASHVVARRREAL